jgi:uncharacterized protein (DUF1501 family)
MASNDPILAAALSRRGFLGLGLGAFAGALAPIQRLLASPGLQPQAGERFLVVVNLRGGCDGLNLAVPFRLADYYRLRPTIAIQQAQGLPLASGPYPSSDYLLHPSLARLHARWVQGQLGIANLVGYPDPDLSHAESTEIWSRGVRRPATGQHGGWIARYKDRNARADLGVIGINTGRILDFQGGETAPLVLGGLSELGFPADPRHGARSTYRNQVLRSLVAGFQSAGAAGEVKQALEQAYGQIEHIQNIVQNYQSTIVYPQNGLGRSLREAAMLVQADLGTRVFYVGTGGYDTHGSQGGATGTQANLFSGLDQALGAFADDLEGMAAWNRCIVAVISEFGRRNDENGSRGTDHGSANCVLLLGGAVRGGVYGRPHSEADLDRDHAQYAIDFRTIYKEIVQQHLGADPAAVFPEPIANEVPLGFVM